VTGLELGGLAGSLLADKLSDVFVGRASKGRVGMRIRVVIAYLAALAAALALFARTPVGASSTQWWSVFLIGMGIYGPQMLIGLCGAELVGRANVGASEGLMGLVAYLGAAMAGLPLANLVKRCGWEVFFRVLIPCALIPVALLAGLVRAPAHSEKRNPGA